MSTEKSGGTPTGPSKLSRINDPKVIWAKIERLNQSIKYNAEPKPEPEREPQTAKEEIVEIAVEGVEKRGAIFKGTPVSCKMISSVKKTYIPCSQEEFHVYEQQIQSVSVHHRHSLVTSHGLCYETFLDRAKSFYMVTDEVDTVSHYFKLKFEAFLEEKDFARQKIINMTPSEKKSMLKKWWEYSWDSFKTILGDVVWGLLYLYDLGYTRVGLRVYVSEDKSGVHGKILPFINVNKASCYNDLDALLRFMKNSLWLENRALNITHSHNMYVHTSFELQDFFDQIRRATVDCGNSTMSLEFAVRALNHPYIWDSLQRIEFMKRLRNLTQSGNVSLKAFEDELVLDMGPEYGPNFWYGQLKEGSLMKDIYLKGKEEKGPVKEYTSSSDIIRYFHALGSHVNEYIVDKKIIDHSASELMFRETFPKMYVYLYRAVLNVRPSEGALPTEVRLLADLKEWILRL